MLTKNRKEEIVKELEGALARSTSVVFVNFHTLSAGNATALRKDLRDKGVEYKVSRKTLLKRAFAGKINGDMSNLNGEVAIAFGTDQLAPAREVNAFAKTHKGSLEILGGVFEGSFVDGIKMLEIANIPDRQVLYAQFVNLINSPIQRFAVALDQIAKSKN